MTRDEFLGRLGELLACLPAEQVEETKAQLDAYRRENAGLIKRNLELEEEEQRRIAQEKALQKQMQ